MQDPLRSCKLKKVNTHKRNVLFLIKFFCLVMASSSYLLQYLFTEVKVLFFVLKLGLA